MGVRPDKHRAKGQRRKLPHTSESVTGDPAPSWPPPLSPRFSSRTPVPLPTLQSPSLNPSHPGPSSSPAFSSSLPPVCSTSSGQEPPSSCHPHAGSPSLYPCKPLILNHIPARRCGPARLNCVTPSAVQSFLSWGLPVSCSRFLWRHQGEFPISAFLLGAGTGGLLAIGE